MRITRINIGGVSFETGAVNVFVGKNNSGKSTLLREVSALCFPQNHTQFKDTKWKAEIAISVSPLKRTMEEVFERPDLIPEVESANTNEVVSHLRPRVTKSIEHSSAVNGRRLSGIATSSCYESGEPFELTVDDRGGVGSDVGASNHVLEWILDFLSTVHISTEFCEDRLSKSFGTRIEDIEAMASGPADRIASLYLNEAMQEDMNLVLEKVFDVRIGFDDLRQADTRLRIMPDRPIPHDVVGVVEKARWWGNNSPLLSEQGDGLKAFVSLLLTLIDPFSKVIFIDEPETFLHPPQRREMGKAVVDAANRGKQVFVATHDADFIRGVLTEECDPCVMYLNVIDGEHTAERIDLATFADCRAGASGRAKAGVQMLNERVINSLFYDQTILVENENDRVVYEHYCQQRLYAEFQGRHFVGLNGSGTVLVLFDLMANAKMSVCCIMDIDFLLNTEASSSFVNQAAPLLREKHFQFASDMHTRDDYEEVKKSLKKKGLEAFDEQSRAVAEELIEEYGRYGVHIIPQGELESWFSGSQSIGKNDIGKMIEAISGDEVELKSLHCFMERVFQSK